MKTLARIVPAALLLNLSAASAWAQYRPPPLTESQRLTYEGDDRRTEASKLLSSSDKGDRESAPAKFKKAIESYQKALAADPNAVAAAAGLGAAANTLQDYALAAKALGPVNAANPEDLAVAYQLGVALYKLQRFSEGIPLLEKAATQDDPEQLLGHLYLGQYYLRQGRGANAISALNRYLKLRPPELGANDSDVYFLLGNAYLLAHRPPFARTAFERAQRGQATESVKVQLGLERVLEAENRYPDAVALLDGVMSRNPKVPEARERLGRVLIQLNDLKRAETVANDLVRINASPAAYLLLGDVKIAQKQGGPAEGALRKALEGAPGNLAIQISLAKALQQQGKSEQAIALLESAAKAGADTVEVWAVLGSVNRRAGHVQRAVQMHQRVLQLAPNLALGHVLLGADHFATGQWDQTIDDYEAALKADPEDAKTRHWLSLALQHRARQRADNNRLDEAVPDLRRAADLERTAGVSRNLGAVLMSQKSYHDARVVLDQSVKLPDATWRDHQLLGYALVGSDDARGAIVAFEQSATMTQDKDSLGEIYAGWALAKLDVGEFDIAVVKLGEQGASKRAAQVMSSNLPLALLRRGLQHLKDGDVAAAAKDVEGAKKIAVSKDSALLAGFVRALIDVEEGKFADGNAGLKKAIAANPKWLVANTKTLLEAYVDYRSGKFIEARKVLGPAQRKLDPKQSPWATDLVRSSYRREGERAYAKGAMPIAEKAFKSAAGMEANNPFVQHNLACIRYRRGQTAEAVTVWQRVEGVVPEADLNLGIDAQEKKHDFKRAVTYYRKYAATNGPRAALAREWKDRLQGIYGIADANSETTEARAP